AVNLLEKKLAVVKPALVNSNALVFGAARILTRDHAGALSFFKDRLDGPGADKDWTRWYYAFVLLLEREFMPAADQFILLAGGSGNGLVTGLSAFLLSGTLAQFLPDRREEFLLFAGRGRDRVKRRVRTRSAWDRGLKRVETEIHVVILAAYTGKAADYIYGDAK
ncbi:MAG: hypothetical protein LBQ44_11170, partial [Treponema sp.]|nr:hypothetical protein [Treponema sp.]